MTAVTWQDVQTSVGRDLTLAEQSQSELWIADAERLIAAGFRIRGWDFLSVDHDALDMVIREMVSARVLSPNPGRVSREVAVDDGRVRDEFTSYATGQLAVLDDWWDLLRPVDSSNSGAFSVTPSWSTPHRHGSEYWGLR